MNEGDGSRYVCTHICVDAEICGPILCSSLLFSLASDPARECYKLRQQVVPEAKRVKTVAGRERSSVSLSFSIPSTLRLINSALPIAFPVRYDIQSLPVY